MMLVGDYYWLKSDLNMAVKHIRRVGDHERQVMCQTSLPGHLQAGMAGQPCEKCYLYYLVELMA